MRPPLLTPRMLHPVLAFTHMCGRVTVFPPPEQVYSAFNWTPRTQVKVVILGQDPYHGPGQVRLFAPRTLLSLSLPSLPSSSRLR